MNMLQKNINIIGENVLERLQLTSKPWVIMIIIISIKGNYIIITHE